MKRILILWGEYVSWMKLVVLVIAILFTACEKDSGYLEEQEDEKSNIEHFLSLHGLDYQKTASGLYIKIIKEGSGNVPTMDDYIVFDETGWLLDSTMITTRSKEEAIAHNFFDSATIYGPNKRQLKNLLNGLSEAFTNLKEGGEAKVIVPYNLGYGKYPQSNGLIPEYSTLLYDIKLISVITDPVAHEKNEIETFISENDSFAMIVDGLYYKQIKKGNRTYPTEYSTIDVSLDMKLLDGRALNSKQLSLTSDDIPMEGLRMGMNYMSEGEEGEFIIRSDLAYGSNPSLTIPPYSTIWVKVDMKEFEEQ